MLFTFTATEPPNGKAGTRLAPRLKPRGVEYTSIDGSQDAASSDEDVSLLGVASGTGILEFSPDKAGMDVTPINLRFNDATESSNRKQSPPPVLQALESKYTSIVIEFVYS